MSKFKVGDKVHLLNSVGNIVYGNRGTIQTEFYDILTGKYTYAVLFASQEEPIYVNPEDIDFYNNPHIASTFNIERTD